VQLASRSSLMDIGTPVQARIIQRQRRSGVHLGVARIACGVRNCWTNVAGIMPDTYGDFGPRRRHVVRFKTGFRLGPDSVVALSPRIERQWASAQRNRIPWRDFEPKYRRKREHHPYRGDWLTVPAGEVRFRCPVCRRVNVAHVEGPCPGTEDDDGCQYCGDPSAVSEWLSELNLPAD
jgi:hypothetical protein